MDKHTKTPFTIGHDDWFADCPFIPIMCGDTKIAEVLPKDGEGLSAEDRANAAFIVRAVNCHAELVALAEQFEKTIQFYMRKDAADGDDEGARMKGGTLRDVRELLAKARGETP